MNEQNSRDLKSKKLKYSRAGQFFVSQNKKEPKKFKKNEIYMNLFPEMYRMKNSIFVNFNFFKNFNLNWIDWSGTDNLIIHSNIFSLLILYRFSWSQHPLFSKRFLVQV